MNRETTSPGEAAGITEETIGQVVHAFYARVRRDAELGPIFNGEIGEGWDEHLAKLCDFWSSVMLRTNRFEGRPMAAHVKLDEAEARHFQRWLAMFGETVDEVCPGTAAELFKSRASTIAQSLQFGMGAFRGQPPGSPLKTRGAI